MTIGSITKEIAFLSAILALGSLQPAGADDAVAAVGVADAGAENRALVWQEDLEAALTSAQANYQSVFVVFTSPDCPWCERLKTNTLRDPEIKALLSNFSLAEIDISRQKDVAASYRVKGVPTLLILSANGAPRASVSGYMPPAELKPFLEKRLNPDLVPQENSAGQALLDILDKGDVPSGKWPGIMIAMSSPEQRDAIRERLFQMPEFPYQELVRLLQDGRIAVRLGALELLEEKVGDNFGFDPWLDVDNMDSNREALARFANLNTDRQKDAGIRYSTLTAEEIDSYVRDLMAEDRQRTLRAKRMLEQGGSDAASRLSEFLAENTEIPQGLVQRIKEVQYAIMVPSLLNMEPSVFAHRMIFGTLDVRLQCISALRAMNEEAMPILHDLLKDDNAMVREVAIDVVASIGGISAAKTLGEHLENEKDPEVIYSILNGLGSVRSKTGLEVLKEYSRHSNEDFALAAINSIASLDTKLADKAIRDALQDDRWRVRVAALDAVKSIELKALVEEVADRLADEDDFVRYSAVQTITGLSPGKKELKMLENAFLADDKLKGAVISAFGSLDKPLPKSFLPALKGMPPEVLLVAITGFSECGQPGVEAASEYIDHPDLDVSCAAIRLVAERGMDAVKMQNRIVDVLRSGERKKVMAALESIQVGTEPLQFAGSLDVQIDLSDIIGADLGGAGEEPSAEDSPVLEDLFSAFDPEGTDDAQSSAEPDRLADESQNSDEAIDEAEPESVDIQNLFAAFDPGDGEEAGEGGSSNEQTQTQQGVEGIIEAVEENFADTEDRELRFAAALLLLKLGETTSLPFLTEEIDETTVERKISIADTLEKVDSGKIFPLMTRLLNDDNKSVRRAMLDSMLNLAEKSEDYLVAVFEELKKGDSNVDIYDIFNTYQWQYLTERDAAAKRIMRSWALGLLEDDDPATQNFGLIVLAKTWRRGDSEKVKEFLESDDPFQRRTAYYAIGSNNKSLFTEQLDNLIKDPSEHVRLVAPYIYNQRRGWRGAKWVHYLDESHTTLDRNISYSSSSIAPKLQEKPRQALMELSRDSSPKVRVEAFLCLLSNRVSIDLSEFQDTIKHFPDREVIAAKISDFLLDNYEELGSSFKVLLPYLEPGRVDSETNEKLKKHFLVEEESGKGKDGQVVYRHEDKALPATFRANTSTGNEAASNEFRIMYFSNPGCSDCERVSRLLAELKINFPGMQVQELNVKKVASMRVNEALSRRYGVPQKKRLVTPAVFAAGGFLVGSEISFARLGDLLARSSTMEAPDWGEVDEQELQRAEQSISDRYANMGIGFVLFAGLLDGVNPCAFATIIFLLSYLQVAKRKPFEIAQVGGAFILAVFISYFGMGLGLAKFIVELSVLEYFGRIITWAMSALALVIMFLNIRDGILCLRGRLEDTALQLPDFLKSRIHAAVRVGARHRHFVIAAFVAGVVISVLELACTGQVYLPTILFMLDSGKDVAGAVVYLLFYNLAFILPLMVVFACAYFGLKSDTLSRLLHRHAAFVKFATAALFLLLFVLLVYGDRIMVILQ